MLLVSRNKEAGSVLHQAVGTEACTMLFPGFINHNRILTIRISFHGGDRGWCLGCKVSGKHTHGLAQSRLSNYNVEQTAFASQWKEVTLATKNRPCSRCFCNNGDIVDGRPYSCNQKARGPHNQFAPCDFPESTCTSAAYPSPGAPAPGPGQMHRQVFCWIQDHVNAFAAGKLADHHRKDGGIDTGWHCRTSSFISTWGAWSHKSAQRSHRFKKSRTASLNGWTAVGFSAVFRKVRERVPQVWDFVKALLACCC